jgi:hypothetical protein
MSCDAFNAQAISLHGEANPDSFIDLHERLAVSHPQPLNQPAAVHCSDLIQERD